MIGSARQRHLVARDMQDPPCEIRAGRHQKGGVVQPRASLIVRLGGCVLFKLQQGNTAGAERGAFVALIEESQSERAA